MSKGITRLRPIRARLIFNARSGQAGQSAQYLADVCMALQDWGISPEVYMVRPSEDQVEDVVREAVKSGTELILAAGGDGTVESVARALAGRSATLGIIPIGTRNNLAFNLGIPGDIEGAVALLRKGRRVQVDVGQVRQGGVKRWFFEASSLGLASALFPYADDLQHGDLAQIPGLLSTIVASMPSKLWLTLDRRKLPEVNTLVAVISNMPYIGPHLRLSREVSCIDGLLDVFLFSDMTKLDLLLSVINQSEDNTLNDLTIPHYRAKKVTVRADPPMPVLADDFGMASADVTYTCRARALTVIAGPAMVKGAPGYRAVIRG